ncbi:MAG: zinc ribbon domain-containing protein [Deltaproteobacteria bacterium]|nr:zinc ribbon domain-containing protein [Deltaproteobacteria bacterium]
MLGNPIYAGRFWWGDTELESADPTLIPWAPSERVLARLDGHPYTRAQSQSQSQSFLYSGMLTCGHCGSAITAEIKKGRCVYYHCAQRCEGAQCVREEKVSEALLESVRVLTMPETLRGLVTEGLKGSHRDVVRETRERVAAPRARYDRLGALIDEANTDQLEGRISAEFFGARRAEWDTDRAQAQE